MEAVKKLNEHFLSCSICTDRFTDPCTLGCGHTFCRGCLAEFTKTQQEALQAESLLCAICRQMTKVPHPKRKVQKWPKQIKPHFLIQGLLDTIGDSADTTTGAAADSTCRQCFPCEQMGKSVQAQSICQDCEVTLCEVCMKMHGVVPATSHHALVDLQDEHMIKAEQRVICHEHKKAVEFYCKVCNKAICEKCCILHHRKCDSVLTIESMMAEMKSTVEGKQRSIVATVRTLERNLESKRTKIGEIGKYKSTTQTNIRRVSQQAVDIIIQKETQLMDELDEFTKKQTGELRGQIKSEETDLHMYQQYSDFIAQALNSESQMELFDGYQMCRSEAVDCEVMDVETGLTVRLSDRMELIDELDEFFRARFQLCRLNITHNDTLLTGDAVLHDTINTSTEGDKEMSYPVDVTVLDVDGIETVVVTDERNKCVKSFFTRGSQKQSSTLGLTNTPHTVTKWKENRVVVSVFRDKAFLIILVTPDLVLHSTVTTQKEYRCIAALSTSTLAAGSCNPPSIDVIDMAGRIIRSVTTFKTGLNLIKYPWFMCTTVDGHILVSDDVSNSVYCLSTEGDTVFTHTFRNNDLRGIISTSTREVLVIKYKECRIVHLAKSGQFLKDLLTPQNGLLSPSGICLHCDRLYLTNTEDRCVKLYRFQ